jgi:hypothetical protein
MSCRPLGIAGTFVTSVPNVSRAPRKPARAEPEETGQVPVDYPHEHGLGGTVGFHREVDLGVMGTSAVMVEPR